MQLHSGGDVLSKETSALQNEKRPDQRGAERRIDLPDQNRCNNTVLRKATRRVSQLYDAMLAPGGLRNTQRSILHQISQSGAASLTELAKSLVLDPSALGNNLKPLEREGFVVVEVNPADKRSRVARLTKLGAAKLAATEALWQAAQHCFEKKIGIAKAKALRKTLARVAAVTLDGAAPASRTHDRGAGAEQEGRCNITALKKASRRVSLLYDSVLAPTGLRSTQRSILRNIYRFGNPTMSQLAEALVLDRSALGHNLRPLERDGYILLGIDPADKRNRLATLTPKGEDKLAEGAALWQVAQDRFEHAFGAAQASALRDMLAMISMEKFEGCS